jgi:hypothetical protein
LCSIAQITTREVKEEKQYTKPQTYDSTYYFYNPESELTFFVNQDIYILPKSTTYSEYSRDWLDYRYFFIKPSIDIPSYYKYIYNISNKNRTIYDTLVNKRLKIIDVIYWGNDWKMKLLRIDNGDTIYFCPNMNYNSYKELPFILVGYYEKQKELYLNKTFIAKDEFEKYGNDFFQSYQIFDLNSGLKVNCVKNSKWKCVDLTFINTKVYEFLLPVLIFRNDSGEEISVNFAKDFYRRNLCFQNKSVEIDDFYTSEEYKEIVLKEKQNEELLKQEEINRKRRKEQLNKKYGYKLAELINNNKVSVGMAKDLCRQSWGMPYSVDKITNESGTFEVWQYDYKTFLYFENDTLKLIKE